MNSVLCHDKLYDHVFKSWTISLPLCLIVNCYFVIFLVDRGSLVMIVNYDDVIIVVDNQPSLWWPWTVTIYSSWSSKKMPKIHMPSKCIFFIVKSLLLSVTSHFWMALNVFEEIQTLNMAQNMCLMVLKYPKNTQINVKTFVTCYCCFL